MSNPVPSRSKFNLHEGASIRSDQPLCVSTPATPWSYAASFVVEGTADGAMVAELLVWVKGGSVGVSYVDRSGQNLRHEVMVAATTEPCRIPQVVQPGERGRVMIRTGPDGVPAQVEIHGLEMRPVSADELAAADAVTELEPHPGWSAFFGNYARSIPEQIRSLRFQRIQAGTRLEWLEELSVIVAPGEQISRAVYVSGLYEPTTAVVLRSWLQSGATFLDIGANIGLFTMLGSRWVGASGRVIAFEPSPRERERLTAHLHLNSIDNVEVVAAAAAAHEGSGELMIATQQHSGLNTLAGRFAYGGVKVADTVAVPLVTLDSLIESAVLARVDVIKLDIEGGEHAALKGAAAVLRQFRPRLIVEVVADALSACGASVDALRELLDGARYELFEIDEHAALQRIPRSQPLYDGNLVALPQE